MTTPWSALLRQDLKGWFRGRAFAMVLITALVPPLLTAAWVFTHQNDVAIADITWSPSEPTQDDNVTIFVVVANPFRSDVGAFNVSVRLGFYETGPLGDLRFRDRLNETRSIGHLGPGERRTLDFVWEAEPGTFVIEALADVDDVLQEIEERNNPRFAQIQVRFPEVRPQVPGPGNASGNASLPELDAAVLNVTWSPPELYAQENGTFTALVQNEGPGDLLNGTVRMEVVRLSDLGFVQATVRTTQSTVNLTAGQSTTVDLAWPNMAFGSHAIVARLQTAGVARDTDPNNDLVAEQLFIDRRVVFQEPEEKATIKDFYREILGLLHLRLLVPLIALFYAAGVIEDERARGNLTYLLTRPVPRWAIPAARFVLTLVVGAAAVGFGVLLTFLLLLGAPGGNPGFLYWPLLFSLVTLFVYGSLFVAIGVATERPYLVGLLYVLGFEALVLLGRGVLVNGQPLLQEWVTYLALSRWVGEAFGGWNPDVALQVWPEGAAAGRAMLILLGVAVTGLASAFALMRRRQFDV